MDISIILATFNRDETLKITLESFRQLDGGELDWEVIVVDNAVSESTKALVNAFRDDYQLCYVQEARPGKNSALNTGLQHAKGDLYIFTDDDVIPDKNWLRVYWEGMQRWPAAHIFGGHIRPSFPEMDNNSCFFDLENPFVRSALGLTDTQTKEMETNAFGIHGANMAVKSELFHSGNKFNANVGPNGTNYVMGSETEFLLRMSKLGHKSVFLPQASVLHQIRPEQLTTQWIAGRAYRAGKGKAAFRIDKTQFNQIHGVPRFLYHKVPRLLAKLIFYKLISHRNYFDTLIDYHLAKGSFVYFWTESNAQSGAE